jgi:hypothetical protein
MGFGTYTVSCLRQILRSDLEVVEASYRGVSAEVSESSQVDQSIDASYKTASGATRDMIADLAASGGWPAFLPASWTSC